MDDPDTVLIMYPAYGLGYDEARKSLEMPANRAGVVRAPRPEELNPKSQRGDIVYTYILRQMQEPVAPPDSERLAFAQADGYRVKFSEGTNSPHGFVVGPNSHCDFVLHPSDGCRNYYFAFQFDDRGQLLLQDLNHADTTTVQYDNWHSLGERPGGRWVIGGCRHTDGVTNIFLQAPRKMRFLIRIPARNTRSPAFRDRLASFRKVKQGPAADALAAVLARRVGTVAGYAELVPPAMYRRFLGSGHFSSVFYAWNTSTGMDMAVRRPVRFNAQKPCRTVAEAWKETAALLSSISHPHLVRFLGSSMDMCPEFYLEYIPGGTLAEHMIYPADLSNLEALQVLSQAADGLAYLHGRHLCHGDLAPSKIMVAQRDKRNGICIKFADFGLPKSMMGLTGLCGNGAYMAPEVYQDFALHNKPPSSGEKPFAADIWSLGVIVSEMLYGLPDCPVDASWHGKVRAHVQRGQSTAGVSTVPFLLDHMLAMDPKARETASHCFRAVAQLLEPTGLHVPPASLEKHKPQNTITKERCGSGASSTPSGAASGVKDGTNTSTNDSMRVK